MAQISRKTATRGKRIAAPKPKKVAARPTSHVVVLVATRKGAWLYHGDGARRRWRTDGPHFLGHVVHHMMLDPRDGRTILAAGWFYAVRGLFLPSRRAPTRPAHQSDVSLRI